MDSVPSLALLNPVIVFDGSLDPPDSSDAPIMLCYRQPSFTSLGTGPIPKGFKSLADFRESYTGVSYARSLGRVRRLGHADLDLQHRRNASPGL
jgi:hypothetical protein